MSNEGFLRRWARLKATGGAAEPLAEAPQRPAPVPVAVPEPASTRQDDTEAPPPVSLPSLEDAARLTPDADFSAFVGKGVDKAVQRLALKKVFADPHFNLIDGLDTYMSDYNKASPLTPAMLASLKHAPGMLDRLLGDRQADAEAAAGQAREPGQEAAPELAHAAAPAHGQEHANEQEQSSTQQGNA